MTEPGWYPDPYQGGQQRYWDGAAWTEHVHPSSPPAAVPAGGSSRTGLVIAAMAVVLVVAAVVTFLVVRDDGSSTADRDDSSSERDSDEGDGGGGGIDASQFRAEVRACEVERRTIATALEAWKAVEPGGPVSSTGLPLSLDQLAEPGPANFLVEAPDPDDWSYDSETGTVEPIAGGSYSQAVVDECVSG